MLLYYTVENFRSINEKVVLDMRANNRLRHHREHVLQPKSTINALKTSVLYGGNASGKSNIIKSVKFVRDCILSNEIERFEGFKFTTQKNKPAKFYIEFYVREEHLGYGFSILNETNPIITEEYLYKLYSKTEKKIFSREYDIETEEIKIESDILESAPDSLKELESLVKYRSNTQLVLSYALRSTDKQREALSDKFNKYISFSLHFFLEGLRIVFPTSSYSKSVNDFLMDKPYLTHLINLDTGIESLGSREVSLERFDDDIRDELRKRLLKPEVDNLSIEASGNRYIASMDNETSKIVMKELTTVRSVDHKEFHLSFSDESDGTKRLLDLLPIIDTSGKSPVTYLIDEFERCLHPSLSRALLSKLLSDQDNQNQLIFSTHEINLLDTNLLRRDEIWLVQKERNHNTTLYSLDEYSTRYDKDIRSAYLKGFFGAIPNLSKFIR